MKDEVDKKWLAISYGCILLAIYFLFIAYCSISPVVEKELNVEIPSTYVTGNFTSGISSFSSFSGMSLTVVAVVTLIFVIILLSLGTRAMGAALL